MESEDVAVDEVGHDNLRGDTRDTGSDQRWPVAAT